MYETVFCLKYHMAKIGFGNETEQIAMMGFSMSGTEMHFCEEQIIILSKSV